MMGKNSTIISIWPGIGPFRKYPGSGFKPLARLLCVFSIGHAYETPDYPDHRNPCRACGDMAEHPQSACRQGRDQKEPPGPAGEGGGFVFAEYFLNHISHALIHSD
jgi:hypothetical protein